MTNEERRAALVDAVAALVASEGVNAVSMEAAAAEAGVSRALVYKHFANRDQLLAALYRREVARLDDAVAAAAGRAKGFEATVRATIRATFEVAGTRGPALAALRPAVANDPAFRAEQLARDERTETYFARLAMDEFGVGPAEAAAAAAVARAGAESVVAQWCAKPTRQRRRFLEDLYVEMTLGGFTRLATRRPSTRG